MECCRMVLTHIQTAIDEYNEDASIQMCCIFAESCRRTPGEWMQGKGGVLRGRECIDGEGEGEGEECNNYLLTNSCH